jgi:hypothetical protein
MPLNEEGRNSQVCHPEAERPKDLPRNIRFADRLCGSSTTTRDFTSLAEEPCTLHHETRVTGDPSALRDLRTTVLNDAS